MDEAYFEQIVRREDDKNAGLWKSLYIILSALLLFAGTFGGMFLLLVPGLAVLFGGFFFLLPRLHQEYEYLYINKEFSVDCILNKESRKSMGTWNLNSMEIMAPLGSARLREYDKRECKAFNFSSHVEKKGQYVIIINDSNWTRILIEPDEQMLKAISNQFPRKVYND